MYILDYNRTKMSRANYRFLQLVLCFVIKYVSAGCSVFINMSYATDNEQYEQCKNFFHILHCICPERVHEGNVLVCRMAAFNFINGFRYEEWTFNECVNLVSSVYIRILGVAMTLVFKNRKDAEDFVKLGLDRMKHEAK